VDLKDPHQCFQRVHSTWKQSMQGIIMLNYATLEKASESVVTFLSERNMSLAAPLNAAYSKKRSGGYISAHARTQSFDIANRKQCLSASNLYDLENLNSSLSSLTRPAGLVWTADEVIPLFSNPCNDILAQGKFITLS
jgi:hypothetical protein